MLSTTKNSLVTSTTGISIVNDVEIRFNSAQEFLDLPYDKRKENKTNLIKSMATATLNERLKVAQNIMADMFKDKTYILSKADVERRSDGLNSVTVWDEICPVEQATEEQMARRLFLDASRDEIVAAREKYQGVDVTLNIDKYLAKAAEIYAKMLERKEFKKNLAGKRSSQLSFKGFINITSELLKQGLMSEIELSTLLALSVTNGTWNQTLFSADYKHLSKFKSILPKKHVIYEANDDLYNLRKLNTLNIVSLPKVTTPDRELTTLDKFPFQRISKTTHPTEHAELLEKVFPDDRGVTEEKMRWLLPQLIRGGENNNFDFERFLRGKTLDGVIIEQLINDCKKLRLFRRAKSQGRALVKENSKERDARPIGDNEIGIGRLFLRQVLDRAQGVKVVRRLGGRGTNRNNKSSKRT